MYYETVAKASELVKHFQARWVGQSTIRLTATARATVGELHPCRTRVSMGGIKAAIGMSQDYTTRNERHRVDGFKPLYPEDQGYFLPRKAPAKAVWLCPSCGEPPDT
jgi:hypothetical protein